MTGGKLYEVNKHFSEVELSYRAGIMVMNLDKYNKLDETLKNHLNTSVQVADDHYHNTIYPEYEENAKKILEDNGVKIIAKEDIDIEAFKNAVKPVYDKHEPTFSKYLEKIKEK